MKSLQINSRIQDDDSDHERKTKQIITDRWFKFFIRRENSFMFVITALESVLGKMLNQICYISQ